MCSRSEALNSFSGHVYTPRFYAGQTLLKKHFKQARPYIGGRQTFLTAGLEIT